MSLKKSIISTLKDRSELLRVYFISAKILFIVISFVFFISYVAISSGFYGELFLPYFLIIYVLFVVSINIFVGTSILYLGEKKIPFVVLLLLLLIPIACIGIFLYPVM